MSTANRFQDFFEESRYVDLKNYLYSYLIRKHAVGQSVGPAPEGIVLEVGSGISPVVTHAARIVYSDLSPLALQTLKRAYGRGWYVAADATRLPFKAGAFSYAVCSEVLEHLPDDRPAVEELARTTRPGGCLIVTFPHRKGYFAADDRFVNHFRRYELTEMEALLGDAGVTPMGVEKVLGPLDKVAYLALIWVFTRLVRGGRRAPGSGNGPGRVFPWVFKWANRLYGAAAYVDARITPRFWSTVLLIKARKNGDGRHG